VESCHQSQVCRKTPYGAGFLAKAGLSVVSNIKSLNAGMTDVYQAKNSVWSNYFLVGSAWTQSINPFSTDGKIPPTWENEIGGSSLLSNSSMETYVQNPKSVMPAFNDLILLTTDSPAFAKNPAP
jgi:hypothetical protein